MAIYPATKLNPFSGRKEDLNQGPPDFQRPQLATLRTTAALLRSTPNLFQALGSWGRAKKEKKKPERERRENRSLPKSSLGFFSHSPSFFRSTPATESLEQDTTLPTLSRELNGPRSMYQ